MRPSLVDLDVAFAAEVAASYATSLLQIQQQQQQGPEQQQQQQQWLHYHQQLSSTCVWDIMMKVWNGRL